MRFLRAASALVVLLALFLVPSTADAATGLEVSLNPSNRQTADAPVYVTTWAAEKVSEVSVELTIDGQPFRLDGYRNSNTTGGTGQPFRQSWANGVKFDRPLTDLPAKVSVTYESGETAVVDSVLRPYVDVQISELAYTPTDLGSSHGPVTFTGLVTYKKNATETAPASGANVSVPSDANNSTTVSAGADGRFTLTTYVHRDGAPTVSVVNGHPYAGMYVTGTTSLNVANAKTRISWTAPGMDRDLWIGERLDISGLLEWLAPTGEWLPLGEADYVQIRCDQQVVAMQTRPDGTFSKSFTPEKPCTLYVMYMSDREKFDDAYGEPTPKVRRHAALNGLTWPASPVVQGEPFRLSGTYVEMPGNTPLTSGVGEVFFSPDKKKWRTTGYSGNPDAKGVITLRPYAEEDGYFKFEVTSIGSEPVVKISPLIKVRKRSDFKSFDATPEPIRKGRTLTVRGKLINVFNGDTLWKRNVTLWFRPKGSKTWNKVVVLTTGRNGDFSKAFKATRDGYWRATYAGDAVFYGDTSATDYVDVR